MTSEKFWDITKIWKNPSILIISSLPNNLLHNFWKAKPLVTKIWKKNVTKFEKESLHSHDFLITK